MEDIMRGYDLAPLFRTSVGFDSLFDLLDSTLKMDEAAQSYPPYNIEKRSEDEYRISMAVAGFAPNDLNIVAQNNSLVVTGRQQSTDKSEAKNFLHQGIASRAFERRFQLADHVQVAGASIKDGLLHIDLKREVPESARPKAIPIETLDKQILEDKKAH
jgi:molecular chaperone IbpA